MGTAMTLLLHKGGSEGQTISCIFFFCIWSDAFHPFFIILFWNNTILGWVLVFVTLTLGTREIDKVVSLAMFTFQRMLNCNYANVMFVLLKENGSGTCLQVQREITCVCVGGGIRRIISGEQRE